MLLPTRVSGTALRSLARFGRTRLGGKALFAAFRAELGIGSIAALPDDARADLPLSVEALRGRPPRELPDAGLSPPPRPWSASSDALTEAYRKGERTPEDVTHAALSAARALGARTPSVGPVLEYADESARDDARASGARYRRGAPLGRLDGVPIVIKEQTAVRGLSRRAGTTFLSGAPQAADATCVALLRRAGAIVLGTSPMTELGMSPLGQNAKRTLPRNPHGVDHVAGGSSTGSGVAVATGLVPFAIGADGGGSIRIPAAINGVFGIKPTWGRVSRHGDVMTGSVGHVGPLASSSLDLARALEVIAHRDPFDAETRGAPDVIPGAFVRATGRGVRGLRIGIEESEMADASPDIAKACLEAVRALEREGAVVVPTRLPYARVAAPVGYMTISLEALAEVSAHWRDDADTMSPDLQVTFAAVSQLRASDYVDAQRVRQGLRREVARAFETIDLLALPTIAKTAARATDREMQSGFTDAAALDSLCRFNFLANLTGLPAASAPVGKDAGGLPIGLQLVGDAWDEATVLAACAHLERIGAARTERPRVTAY